MTGPPGAVAGRRVELWRVRLPLHRAHVAAHGREDVREVVLVSVTDDEGIAGWGECPTLARPGYGPEWTDGAWWVLREVLAPQVAAGRDDPGLVGHPMASGAVRDALLDLRLRRAGEGPAAVLGPRATHVAFGVALGLEDGRPAPPASEGEPGPVPPAGDGPALLVAAARRAVAAGAALLVVKVRPGMAVAALAAVQEACPGVPVAVDGNGSFGPGDGPELRAVAALGPAFVEQPLPADDLRASAELAATLAAPVALDESITSPAALEAALALGAGNVLTVKPSRLGGVEAAVAAARRAVAAGWAVHVGGMVESGLGRAAARVVAAGPEVTGPALVGPTSLLFGADVVEPVGATAAGTVPVPAGPGLAPPPDLDRLDALVVDRWPR